MWNKGSAFKWTPKEDRLAVETVDKLLAEGDTLLRKEVFGMSLELFNEQVELKRTILGFRNRYYKLKKGESVSVVAVSNEVNEIASFIDGIITNYEGLVKANEKLKSDNLLLATENTRLANELNQSNIDYDSLLRVIDRARKIVISEEISCLNEPSTRFIMEQNGNLITA